MNARHATYVLPQPSYAPALWQTPPASDQILGTISQLVEHMNRMNSQMDEIHGSVKINVFVVVDHKKDKQIFFVDQLPSQATASPRNLGQLSSQTHNLNHVHVKRRY